VVFALPLATPQSTIPACDVEHDMGPVVKGIFDLGSKANGKVFPIISEDISVSRLPGSA